MVLPRTHPISLFVGISIGAGLAGPVSGQKAGRVPTPRSLTAPMRVVVGLKDPLTPPVIRELKAVFGARIMNIAPGGAYALVLLRPGETLDEVQAKSRRISFVEPEVVMGATKEARTAVVVIPAPKWPKAPTNQ